MPNIESAKKELRKGEKRAFANKKLKDTLKSLTKKSLKAIEGKGGDAKELVMKTMVVIDKAAKKGIIKKNTRDRKKSRLHTRLNKSLAKA